MNPQYEHQFKYADFLSRQIVNTKAKMALWELVALAFGGWECAANKYEQHGAQGLYCSGMQGILEYLLNPHDLIEEAYKRYGEDKELDLEAKKIKLIKVLGGSLAIQFKKKFETIYALYNGTRVFNESEDFKQLSASFNTQNDISHERKVILPSSKGLAKSKCFEVAANVSKLLETLTEEERVYVLGVI